MAEFEWMKDKLYVELVGLVVRSEGGYVWDPKDKGGATKFGIAFNFNRPELARIGITQPLQMKDLTLDQAREIYYWKYWLGSNCAHIASKRLCYIHFDSAVNHGMGGAANIMFKLSPKPYNYEGNGKNVLLWLNLFIQYVAYRAIYFTNCETWDTHGKGWIRRLAHVTLDGLKMG